jgi:cytochrome c oxidase subunit 4
MSEQNLHPAQHDQPEHHIVSPIIYIAVGVTLLVLTGTTVGVSYIDLGVFNAVAALAIAVIKAVLVVLFFMHVKYSSKLTKLTVIAGVFIFLGLISMTMADYISRAWGRW